MATSKLPQNMSLDKDQQKEYNKKIKSTKTQEQDGPGVIYLGHIPRGFMEEQMKKYFKQFGRVNKLRMARSKKTGNSKGYAFVEFHSAVVAKIVAETMNNYLMFHRLLKCQFVPMEKVHPQTFVGSKRYFKKPKAHLVAMQRHNRASSDRQSKESLRKMRTKNTKTRAKLAEMGIDYDFTLPGDKKPESTAALKTEHDSDDDDDDKDDVKPNVEELSSIQQEALHVLYDDSDEDEIEFKTPPQTVRRRSSMYRSAPGQSDKKDSEPRSTKTSLKRKVADSKSTSKKKRAVKPAGTNTRPKRVRK